MTFTYTPLPAFQVSGIAQDFRGANNYRPNVIGDPYAPEGERTVQNWFNRSNVVVPTDPSQPFGNAERNSVRGPMFWQMDLALSRRIPMPWPAGARRVPRRVLQSPQPDQLPRAERQSQRSGVRNDYVDVWTHGRRKSG